MLFCFWNVFFQMYHKTACKYIFTCLFMMHLKKCILKTKQHQNNFLSWQIIKFIFLTFNETWMRLNESWEVVMLFIVLSSAFCATEMWFNWFYVFYLNKNKAKNLYQSVCFTIWLYETLLLRLFNKNLCKKR